METEFVFLLLLLFGVMIVAIVRIATYLEKAINAKPYHVHIQTTLREDDRKYVFNKALDITIPPAVGQIIQDKDGFKVVEVLPYRKGEKYCCTLRCEMLSAEQFDLKNVLESLIQNDWHIDTSLSDPLPDD